MLNAIIPTTKSLINIYVTEQIKNKQTFDNINEQTKQINIE